MAFRLWRDAFIFKSQYILTHHIKHISIVLYDSFEENNDDHCNADIIVVENIRVLFKWIERDLRKIIKKNKESIVDWIYFKKYILFNKIFKHSST